MGSFKKKQYGMVKPVKHKVQKLAKPKASELKMIYRDMVKDSLHKLDYMSHAMRWYEQVALWLNAQKTVPLKQMKHVDIAFKKKKEGLTAKTDKNKMIAFVGNIDQMQRACKGFLTLPDLAPYLKAVVVAEFKAREKEEKIEPKFEKLTSLLAGMFPYSSLFYRVVPNKQQSEPRKISHDGGTLLYKQSFAKILLLRYRAQGPLSFAVEEAAHIARFASMRKNDGRFIPNPTIQVAAYQHLMEDFVHWAKRHKGKLVRVAKKKKDSDPSVEEVEGLNVKLTKISPHDVQVQDIEIAMREGEPVSNIELDRDEIETKFSEALKDIEDKHD